MRKIIFMALAACSFAVSAQAQTAKGLWLTPHLYGGGSIMTGISGIANNLESRLAPAYGFGIDVAFVFRDGIGIGSGVAWRTSYFKWRENTSTGPTDYVGGQAQIDVPLCFRYAKNKQFVLDAGVISSFFLGGEQYVRRNGEEKPRTSYREADAASSRYTIAPFVYFGAHILRGDHLRLTAGPLISYQVSDNFRKGSGLSGHHLSAGIKLGLGIHALRGKKVKERG